MKYFRIKIDEKLLWKQQISDLAIKLHRPIAILTTLRHFIDSEILNQEL